MARIASKDFTLNTPAGHVRYRAGTQIEPAHEENWYVKAHSHEAGLTTSTGDEDVAGDDASIGKGPDTGPDAGEDPAPEAEAQAEASAAAETEEKLEELSALDRARKLKK